MYFVLICFNFRINFQVIHQRYKVLMASNTAESGVKQRAKFTELATKTFYETEYKQYRAKVMTINDSAPMLCLSTYYCAKDNDGWWPTGKNFFMTADAFHFFCNKQQAIQQLFDSTRSSMPTCNFVLGFFFTLNWLTFRSNISSSIIQYYVLVYR